VTPAFGNRRRRAAGDGGRHRETTAALAVRLAVWPAAALGALAAGVVCGWAFERAVEAVVGPGDGDYGSLYGLALSMAIYGWLPLALVVPALFLLARAGGPFRLPAVGITLFAASGLGFMLVGIDERSVQAWLVAWLVFALLVPRPPVRPRTRGKAGLQGLRRL